MENDKIKNGAFILARRLFSSLVWREKPATWIKIWLYILGNVSHQDSENYKKGEGFFQFSKELDKIGCDVTVDIVKKSISFFKKSAMISTRRSTRGMRIKVLNYNRYQTLDNYTGTSISTKKALRKHQESTPIDKNVKNVKNVKYSEDSQGISAIIKEFEDIDIKNKTYYGNTTQRKACLFLIENYGLNQVLKLIPKLKETNRRSVYQITTPWEMKEKITKVFNELNRVGKDKKDTYYG